MIWTKVLPSWCGMDRDECATAAVTGRGALAGRQKPSDLEHILAQEVMLRTGRGGIGGAF